MEPSRYFVRRTDGLPVEAPIETEASPIFLDEVQRFARKLDLSFTLNNSTRTI